MIEHVPHQRHHLVIGRGADIDDIVAAFEAFISCGMPEQPLGSLDDGNNLLARGRCVATDDMIDALFADQILAGRTIGRNDPSRITQVRRKGEVELIRSR